MSVPLTTDMRPRREVTIRVGGILVAGLVLVVAGSRYATAHRIPLLCVPIGVGVGELVGAAMDNLPMGVASGAAIGALGAAVLSLQRS